MCINRVRERVLKGGHDVPVDDIVRRYYRSSHNFWNTYRLLVDQWHLFQNTNDDFSEIATGNRVEISIFNEKLFSSFTETMQGEHHGY